MAVSTSQHIPLPVCSERAQPRPNSARQGGGQGSDGCPAGGTASSRVPLDLWSLRGELDQLGVSALQAHLSEKRGQWRLRLGGELTGLDFLRGGSSCVPAWHCKEVRGAGRKPCSRRTAVHHARGSWLSSACRSGSSWMTRSGKPSLARARSDLPSFWPPLPAPPAECRWYARAFAGDLGDFYVG